MFGTTATDPILHFHPHPEVWLLVAAIAGSYSYAIRVIGPMADRECRRGSCCVREGSRARASRCAMV